MQTEIYTTKPIMVDVFHLTHQIVDDYESGTKPLPEGIIPCTNEITGRPDGQYECKGWIMNPGDYLIFNRVSHKIIEILEPSEFSKKYEELTS